MGERYFQRGQGRVFLQEQGPHPEICYDYQGCARIEGADEPLGDITEVQCPDPNVYDEFEVVDEIRGAGGPITTTMVARFGLVNPILKLRCPFDLAVHFGKCKDPSDFNRGWEKGIVFNRARLTSRALSELTALAEDDRSEILVTGAISARKLYEVDPIAFVQKAGTYITGEVIAVVVCDALSCGECEEISDGCQKIYAVCAPSSIVSPGLPAEVVYTLDGGVTFAESDITYLGADEAPSDAACVGGNLVVISFNSDSLHYAALPGLAAWHEVIAGFVGAGSPNAIWSVDARHTWIVGEAGYIYFTADPTTGVVVQDTGGAAVDENLNDVHFFDTQRGIAVGDNNTVVMTENGGVTWVATADSPAKDARTALLACWMFTENIWWVGDAVGDLWYTTDRGATWTEKAIPVDSPARIREIVFYEGGFGWVSVEGTGPAGHILRTRDGGCTWYVLPEDAGTLPANDYINSIAPCDQNTIWAGGAADVAPDGILVLGS